MEQLEALYKDDPRALKAILAEELTRRVHSDSDYESVMAVSKVLFSKDADADMLNSMSSDELMTVFEEIPSTSKYKLGGEVLNIYEILEMTDIFLQSLK